MSGIQLLVRVNTARLFTSSQMMSIDRPDDLSQKDFYEVMCREIRDHDIAAIHGRAQALGWSVKLWNISDSDHFDDTCEALKAAAEKLSDQVKEVDENARGWSWQ